MSSSELSETETLLRPKTPTSPSFQNHDQPTSLKAFHRNVLVCKVLAAVCITGSTGMDAWALFDQSILARRAWNGGSGTRGARQITDGDWFASLIGVIVMV